MVRGISLERSVKVDGHHWNRNQAFVGNEFRFTEHSHHNGLQIAQRAGCKGFQFLVPRHFCFDESLDVDRFDQVIQLKVLAPQNIACKLCQKLVS